MPNNFSSDSVLRVNDPVISTVIQGYSNSEGIAGFVAPIVNVNTRAGKIIRFGKESFAVLDLRRSPGGNIKRVSASFDTDSYYIRQHAIGSEVPREVYEEAINGAARIDLRAQAALRTAASLQQSWEADVIDTVYNASSFEVANLVTAAGAVADYDNLITDAQELIRKQIGRYANSAIIGADVYRFVKRNAAYRDRIKYTSSASVNLDMIAAWWGLDRGIRVASRQRLDDVTGGLVDMVPAGSILLFYNPEGAVSDGFLASDQADNAQAAFAYTYQLTGYPIAEQERFDEDRKVFVTDLIAEQAVQLVGMGENGKVGAAVLISGITA